MTWQQEGSHYATLLVMSDVGMGMPRAMPNSMVMPMPVTITSQRGLTLGGSDHGTDSGLGKTRTHAQQRDDTCSRRSRDTLYERLDQMSKLLGAMRLAPDGIRGVVLWTENGVQMPLWALSVSDKNLEIFSGTGRTNKAY